MKNEKMKINYETTIYNPKVTDKKLRYALGTIGKNTLFVIGLNPSTANEKKTDLTVSKVMKFAENDGFDSFVMLNLYAQRTPYPNDLDKVLNEQLHTNNLNFIFEELNKHKNPKILAAWGGFIKKRSYFKICIIDIIEKTKLLNVEWVRIGGNLVENKHPRHPSRAEYVRKIEKFEVLEYLKKI
jgi:hypothetical protein